MRISDWSSDVCSSDLIGFAELGAKVIVTGRRAAPLREVADHHPGITGLMADVSVPSDAARTITETFEAWGRIDILVNNAGAGAILPMAEATAEKIADRKSTRLNSSH